jgi:probable HAF family extracellular repeat protein
MKSLGTDEGWAQDINDAGVIVGRASGIDGDGNYFPKAFVNSEGVTYDLESLIDPSTGWTTFFEATGINTQGQFVGEGMYNGQITAFLMTPAVVPEPGSLAALSAIAILMRRRSH